MSDDFSEDIVYYTDINEIEIIVNIDNIAMIEIMLGFFICFHI